MATRNFALILGIVYTLVGILGFLPFALSTPPAGVPEVAVDTLYGYLLGIFPVNILHTIVHLAVGIFGILASRNFNAARSYAGVAAVIFGLLTVMGLIPGLSTTFGLIPLHGNDVWLHAATALIAAYFAITTPGERTREAL